MDHLIQKNNTRSSSLVKNAYRNIMGFENLRKDPIWNIIWKWKGPFRMHSFIWIILQGKILTKEFTAKWGGMPFCHACVTNIEDTLHVVRDCKNAKVIWNSWLNGSSYVDFFSLNAQENNELHDPSFSRPYNPIQVISKYILEIKVAKEANRINSLPSRLVERVKWAAPEYGWWKINIDGAVEKSSDRATCGGLVRDDKGVAWESGIRKLIIERDSSLAMAAIAGEDGPGGVPQMVKLIRN
ncbi:uncharacterized protein LOC133317991 [Gastrolobium bilobum]|uniref:uncharacterized protein LOC133317991 n=1 Tax=Gastrolobium bilobum TaxID=150636 RepID=UPI002AAFCEBA|nr:uncharacterized protein LOC133317991 [Gastrolobium bilobum]